MVINKFRNDIKELCLIKGITQTALAKKRGQSRMRLNQLYGRKIINEEFVKYCEELGYDVEISYVER